MDQPLEKDIEHFMDDPRRGARSFSDSNILFRAQSYRGIQDEEDNERVETEKIYLDDVAIYTSSEEEFSKHNFLTKLHNSELMSKTSVYVDIQKPYQLPSPGFIDTARILID